MLLQHNHLLHTLPKTSRKSSHWQLQRNLDVDMFVACMETMMIFLLYIQPANKQNNMNTLHVNICVHWEMTARHAKIITLLVNSKKSPITTSHANILVVLSNLRINLFKFNMNKTKNYTDLRNVAILV